MILIMLIVYLIAGAFGVGLFLWGAKGYGIDWKKALLLLLLLLLL